MARRRRVSLGRRRMLRGCGGERKQEHAAYSWLCTSCRLAVKFTQSQHACMNRVNADTCTLQVRGAQGYLRDVVL